LQPELADAEFVGEPVGADERREARGEPLLGGRSDREQVGVAPDRRRAGLDLLARGGLVPGVHRGEWPPAAGADADGLEGVVGLTVAATECGGGQRILLSLSLDILRALRLAGFGTLLPLWLTGPSRLPRRQWAGSLSLSRCERGSPARLGATIQN